MSCSSIASRACSRNVFPPWPLWDFLLLPVGAFEAGWHRRVPPKADLSLHDCVV